MQEKLAGQEQPAATEKPGGAEERKAETVVGLACRLRPHQAAAHPHRLRGM